MKSYLITWLSLNFVIWNQKHGIVVMERPCIYLVSSCIETRIFPHSPNNWTQDSTWGGCLCYKQQSKDEKSH